MNDFTELEEELKQLRPAAPSAELSARVESALAASATATAGVLPQPKKQWSWLALGFGVAAAAAAFLLLARVDGPGSRLKVPGVAAITPAPVITKAQPVAGFVPVGVTRVVYGTRDEGLLFPANGDQPVRRLRARSRETLQWKDRSTGASLRVSYPTEEVELIPVSGQ